MRPSLLVVVALLAACGDNIKPMTPDEVPISCGNGVVEAGEQCDDHNEVKDVACDATCRLTCGNGVVDSEPDIGELCDTGIASGPGACPTTCNDNVACTEDVLSGTGCIAECMNVPIGLPANGDGCCPSGANANNDDDCEAVCDNGVLEAGESCDTAIAPGNAGACPTACNDQMVCTTDTLTMAGTCQAACMFTPITMPANGDGCCPPGADATNDMDCAAVCGNSVVEPPAEVCDTGIASGTGACPTMCDDGQACTTNTLANGGTCQAACVFDPITMPANGDGCCPAGANANNDNDCPPVCGNTIVEPGEQCDDGNTSNNDPCSTSCAFLPMAYRFSDLDLRDPHTFVSVFPLCLDITDGGTTSVNGQIAAQIQGDGNSDGLLDLAPTLVFRQYSQSAATMPVELHFADCTAPESSTMCSPSGDMVVMGTATNVTSGSCLAPAAGTIKNPPYSPGITTPTAPCFVTNTVTLTLSVGGIPITLRDAQLAARYVGNPAGTMTNGLLRGFISEADANATIIPPTIPIVGGQPLSRLLPGGSGACPSYSDKDINGVTGWWFYLNFQTTRAPWMD